MSNFENNELSILQSLLDAPERTTRNDKGTRSIFAHHARYDLEKGFPLITTKHVSFKNILHELLWFLSGSTNIKYLQKNKVNIWNEWASDKGEVGNMYGVQWRNWDLATDQIQNLIEGIKQNPNSRRHIVTAWNPSDVTGNLCALPPCHVLFQCYVNDDKLSTSLYMRSNDAFLGRPYNIASYAILTHMIANVTGLKAKELVINVGDLHLYSTHVEAVKQQLKNKPYPLPTLNIKRKVQSIDDFVFDDFELINYQHAGKIKAPVHK